MIEPDGKVSVDGPRVTPDEATELCVYHLRMAAALFQAVPDDGNRSLIQEIERQCGSELDCTTVPAKLWASSIFHEYEQMKADD